MLVSLWGHLLVWLYPSLLWFVWMQPFIRYISMMLVCLMHTSLCSMQCYAWLACFVPSFGSLCFFASLHACLHVHAWVLVLACVIKPNSYHLVWVHTCPWYTRPRVLYRNFAWWHMCHPYSCRHLAIARPPIVATLSCLSSLSLSARVYGYGGGVLYLRCVTRIWVDFKEITKGKWSCYKSLGFSKVWLVTWLYLILLLILG